MESFFRYISYIDLYENRVKLKNVGFLRWKFQNGKHTIELHIKDAINLRGNFRIDEVKTQKTIGFIKLDQGIGSVTKTFPTHMIDNEIYLDTENDSIRLKDMEGFHICFDNKYHFFVPVVLPLSKQEISGELPQNATSIEIESASDNILIEGLEEKYPPPSPVISPIMDMIEEPEKTEEILSPKTTDELLKIKLIEPLHDDKWQQLQKKYPKVHPFSRMNSFLSIKPEDFIILQKGYQKLVHNSFLLHGFYNYGHLILGKLADDENAPFYIGVPGVYYDREKQAAQMFGFVGFESTEQPVQSGSYGYYMIEVMI